MYIFARVAAKYVNVIHEEVMYSVIMHTNEVTSCLTQCFDLPLDIVKCYACIHEYIPILNLGAPQFYMLKYTHTQKKERTIQASFLFGPNVKMTPKTKKKIKMHLQPSWLLIIFKKMITLFIAI